ncbi:MAG: hypothetical protein FGM46_01480 [Ferruginibacter sp.]|nr:hypothetical protein [Ferruginibacter sp.]
MEDTLSKYLRIIGNVLLAFFIFLIAALGFLILSKLLFGLLDNISWFSFLYMSLILLLPSMFFITVFLIYFKRTIKHRSVVVRWLSYAIFSFIIISWMVFLFEDVRTYINYYYTDIGKYNSYNMLFLASNVATIFIVGIIQALSTEKEKDWLDKYND